MKLVVHRNILSDVQLTLVVFILIPLIYSVFSEYCINFSYSSELDSSTNSKALSKKKIMIMNYAEYNNHLDFDSNNNEFCEIIEDIEDIERDIPRSQAGRPVVYCAYFESAGYQRNTP